MPDNDPWWRAATFYQIYVRSWQDSNGDGIGDLAGIIERLDYLKWLGVDCIWLSPTMPSPNTDWGYDVADYCDVHPDLGTLADLDRLVKEGAERGVSVMLDLVPNHSSSAHPWFVDALSGPEAEHRDYYVWAPPKPDGGPPNNWVAATGTSAWTFDDASGQYYLHNFLETQPDLNWWDPRVHTEFEDILRFWFDRGIAGFRIDVAHGLYKDALLRDDPPPRPDDHPTVRAGKVKPVYSAHRPEVHPLYQQWRQMADSYQPQRALLGETWEFDPQRFGDFYGRDQPELHLGFNFTFVMAGFSSRELAGSVEPTLAALPPGATPVWTASNHDVGRFPTRWCGGDAHAVRAALVLLAALPGTMVLYYGDELGMEDVDVPEDQQLDVMFKAHPGQSSRDRCRTPMQWSDGPNAGFTPPAVRPWLPFGHQHEANVAYEQADPGSVLHLSRRLNQLRGAGRLGRVLPLERVFLDDQVWAFTTGDLTVIANLSPEPATCPVPGGDQLTVLVSTASGQSGADESGYGADSPAEALGVPGQLGEVVHLGPWETLVARPRDGG